MNDLSEKNVSDTGNIDIASSPSIIFRELESRSLDFEEDETTSEIKIYENYINQKRGKALEKLTPKLLMLIQEENFEYGIETKADIFIRSQMDSNSLATKSWLNSVFIENSDKPSILIGLLRIIARIDYFDIYPEGQIMAVAALSHENTEVKECGVRAFESWETLDSLKVLENLKVSSQWLQEYIDEVIHDLREEYNVSVYQKDSKK